MTGSSSTFPTGFGTFSLGTITPFGTVSYEQTTAINPTATATYGILQILNNGVAVRLPTGTTTVSGNLIVVMVRGVLLSVVPMAVVPF